MKNEWLLAKGTENSACEVIVFFSSTLRYFLQFVLMLESWDQIIWHNCNFPFLNERLRSFLKETLKKTGLKLLSYHGASIAGLR